jgi:adenine deaminase
MSRGLGVVIVVADAFSLLVVAAQIAANGAGLTAVPGYIDGHKHVFSIVFSAADIFKIIGPNSARLVGMADQIGSLETGKLADIVLLDGNPMERDGIYTMLKAKVVMKEGKILVDKRAAAPATDKRVNR